MSLRVFVATESTWHGIARFPHVLRAAGAKVTLLARPDAVIASTRYVDEVMECDGSIEAFADAVAEHIRRFGERYDWIVVPDENLLREFAHRDDPLIDHWYPFKRDAATSAFIGSKLSFLEECVGLGVPVADFRICKDPQAAVDGAAALGYPLVAKAVYGSGGAGVHLVASESELAAALAATGMPVALQRFVEGKAFSTEVLYDHGTPVCWTSSLQYNRWPNPLGSISARRMIDVPGIERNLEILGRRTSFHGIACIDAILPDDGGPAVFCEMNPMPGAEAMINRRVLHVFAAALRRVMHGEPAVRRAKMPRDRHIVGLFPQALRYLAAKPRELSRWLPALDSLRRAPIDDPRLFVRLWADLICGFVPRMGLRTALSRRLNRAEQGPDLGMRIRSPHGMMVELVDTTDFHKGAGGMETPVGMRSNSVNSPRVTWQQTR